MSKETPEPSLTVKKMRWWLRACFLIILLAAAQGLVGFWQTGSIFVGLASAVIQAACQALLTCVLARQYRTMKLDSRDLLPKESVTFAMYATYYFATTPPMMSWAPYVITRIWPGRLIWWLADLARLPSPKEYQGIVGILYLTSDRFLFRSFDGCNYSIMLPAVQSCSMEPRLSGNLLTVTTKTRSEIYFLRHCPSELELTVGARRWSVSYERTRTVAQSFLRKQGLAYDLPVETLITSAEFEVNHACSRRDRGNFGAKVDVLRNLRDIVTLV